MSSNGNGGRAPRQAVVDLDVLGQVAAFAVAVPLFIAAATGAVMLVWNGLGVGDLLGTGSANFGQALGLAVIIILLGR